MKGFISRIFNKLGVGNDSKKPTKFWQFVKNESAAGEESSADLLLYGPIAETSWWGDEVTPKQFAEDLAALGDVSTIRVRINSSGGDVFAAHTIYNLLKTHAAKIITHIDGLAASAASVIAMVGDEVIMPGNAMMMIHNPWTIAMGEARDMREMADTLDTVRETIIAAYQAKSGMDREKLINLLDATTWLTAEQAKEYGLADTVTEPVRVAASLKPGQYTVNGQQMDFNNLAIWPGALLASAEEASEEEAATADETQTETAAADNGDAEEPTDDPVEAAVNAERARIQAIDELAKGIVGAEPLAFRSKYEKPVSSDEFAVELVKSGQVKNAVLLNARRTAAGSANVPAGNAGDMTNAEAERHANASAISKQVLAMRGIKS